MHLSFGTVADALTGLPVRNAEIRLFDNRTNTPATMYALNGATEITPPLLTDGKGYWQFYAENGVYTRTETVPGGDVRTINDVEIFELAATWGTPEGEPRVELPAAATRAGKVLTFDGLGAVDMQPVSEFQGPGATVAVQSTTTLSPGSPATVVNVGTPGDALLQFGIPKGATGDVTPEAQAAADLASASATTATTQAALAQAAASAATTAATSPSFKLQTNSATPTVPPSGVSSGDSYWAIDLVSNNLVLYTNSSGTGVISNPAIKEPLSSINNVSGLVQYGTTTFNVLYGIADSNGRAAFLALTDGTVVVDLESGSAGKVLLKGGFQTVSGLNQLSAENVAGSYANGQAFLGALLDSTSRVLSGYLADGTFFIGKYDSRILSAVTAAENPGLSRNGPFYSAVGGQIVAYFSGAYAALTTEGTNSEPHALGDRVAFLSTRRRGVTAPYIMNFDGTNQRAMLQQAVYEVYPAAGQSNTPGYISTPALTLTAPYPGQALMFAGGAGPIAEYPAVFGGSGTLTDLHEDTSGAFKGESIASSMASAVLDHELTNRPKLKVVACGSGYPGAAYTAIMKGTGPYNDIIAQVGRAKALGDIEIAAGRGGQATKGAIVRAQILMHGETDWNNASYDTNLATLQSDFETDVKAATGQVEPVPMIITQMAALRFFAAPPDASATVKSPLLQLAASIANPKIFLAGPTYQFMTVDYAHWTNTSKRLAGEMFEKAIRKVVHEGRDWVPLSPKPFSQWTVNVAAGTILIPMNVPVGPLVFDTTLVSDPGNKGFNYTDSLGRTITNVQITGANSDQILVTLSGSLGTSAFLDHAYSNGYSAVNPGITATGSISGTSLSLTAGGTPFQGMPVSGTAVIPGTYLVSGSGTSWTVNNSQAITSRTLTFNAAGPFAGARGCLRDSDPALSRWDGTTHLYDWCVIFRQQVN